jgi:microcystin-dependent protein
MAIRKPLVIDGTSGLPVQLAPDDFLDPMWNGILPTLRRELWTEQIVTADGFRWGRLGGSIEGHEDDYATVIALYPDILISTLPGTGDLVYQPQVSSTTPCLVTTSDELSATNAAWRVFDGKPGTLWRTSANTFPAGEGDQYVQIDLGAGNAMTVSSVDMEGAHAGTRVAAAEFYGANTNPADNAEWYAAATLLARPEWATEEGTGLVIVTNNAVTDTTAYRFFRLRVLRTNGGTELRMNNLYIYAGELDLKSTGDSVNSHLYIRLDGGGPGNHPWQDGKSAYELAVENGFQGTLAEWMDSLVGPEGPQGVKGDTGATGPTGPTPSLTTVINALFPVGSVYLGPAGSQVLTVGTWTRIQGQFLVGSSTSDSSFALGATGGEKAHQLTIAELPAHDHAVPEVCNPGDAGYDAAMWTSGDAVQSGRRNAVMTSAVGSWQAHNNLPPYRAVDMWRRTA